MTLMHKASVKAQYDTIRLAETRRVANLSWHIVGINATLQGGTTVVVGFTFDDAATDQISYAYEEDVAFDKVGLEAAFQVQASLSNLRPWHMS